MLLVLLDSLKLARQLGDELLVVEPDGVSRRRVLPEEVDPPW